MVQHICFTKCAKSMVRRHALIISVTRRAHWPPMASNIVSILRDQ